MNRRKQTNALTIGVSLSLGFFLVISNIPPIHSPYPGTPTYYFGFWVQDNDFFNTYTPQQFVSQYFGTPPYPSLLEWMSFGPVKDVSNGGGFVYTNASLSYITAVAEAAEAYPDAKILVDVGFDMNTQMNYFQDYVGNLSSYPSIYSVAIEGEYTTNQTVANFNTACNIAAGAGLHFVSYYVDPSVLPNNGCGAYLSFHTNFPDAVALSDYDQVGALEGYTSTSCPSCYVGIDSGYYDYTTFPSAMTCPIGANAENNGTNGWNQCVVSTELSTALETFIPYSYVAFAAGYSGGGAGGQSPAYFKDSDNIATDQLWDNPTLRNWIWTDPNYRANFILSTGIPLPSSKLIRPLL